MFPEPVQTLASPSRCGPSSGITGPRIPGCPPDPIGIGGPADARPPGSDGAQAPADRPSRPGPCGPTHSRSGQESARLEPDPVDRTVQQKARFAPIVRKACGPAEKLTPPACCGAVPNGTQPGRGGYEQVLVDRALAAG